MDISSTAAKLLEISHQGNNRFRVESYSVEPLSTNAVVEKNITDMESVGDSIRRAVKRSGTKTKNVAVAVAGSAAITKVITMDADLSQEDMESQIELEADQYIPYSMDEVNLDFEVVGPSEQDPDKVDVLLAASRSENVDVRVGACELGGLQPKIVDVEAFALENAFSLLAEDLPGGGVGQTIALVDIGSTMTTLSVLHDSSIIYGREQVFGGKQLTEEIQHRYGLTYEEAGLAKLIRAGYGLLDLLTFFTVGPKEARAWTVVAGATAPQAAGVIHTDFQRGFIRAETISFDDYIACSGESGARDAGKLRIEGSDYRVVDGDVFHFRFNV